MSKPKRYRNTEVVEALQWTGENAEEMKEWARLHFRTASQYHPIASIYVEVDDCYVPLHEGDWGS